MRLRCCFRLSERITNKIEFKKGVIRLSYNRNIATGKAIPAYLWFAEDGSDIPENEPIQIKLPEKTWRTCGVKKRVRGFALSLGRGIMPCDREPYCKDCKK